MPICSDMVRPAPGTYSSASFSSGSRLIWYSPLMVGVDEFDDDVGADAFDIAVAPVFKWIGGSFAAALFVRALDSCRPKDAIRSRPAAPYLM